jgi:imidazole glycerol-phosphate synthase subunit HisH
MKVGIIDYGVGNLGSVYRALEELRASPTIIDRAIDIHQADALILPGVGNFSECADLLRKGGWMDALKLEAERGRPLLGICLGMQLLATSSSEGSDDMTMYCDNGLNLVPGRVERISRLGCELRVPHVGWNSVAPSETHGGMFAGIPGGTDFYFVHSYAFVVDDPKDVAATTDYGISITAAVQKQNVWGTQFHPEKSSRAGFAVLKNFLERPAC